MLQMTSNAEVAKVAHDVSDRLQRVRTSLLAASDPGRKG